MFTLWRSIHKKVAKYVYTVEIYSEKGSKVCLYCGDLFKKGSKVCLLVVDL